MVIKGLRRAANLPCPSPFCHKAVLPVRYSNKEEFPKKMRTCKIMLNTVADVKEFVNLVSGCAYEVELVSGRYAVDAKSIMGIFSLDLSKPLTLCAHFDDADALFAELRKFKVA